jgi:hypothetical protein
LVALPVAVVVGLLAALVPAWRASVAAHSGRPPRRPPAWHLHARGRLRAAMVQLSRIPARSGLCVVAVAIGCGSLTGRHLLGSGDGWADATVPALITLMAVFVVADAGWLAVRDRGGELADLRMQGLLGIQVAGLIVRELSILVVLGTALGGVFGLAVTVLPGSGHMS